MAGSFHSQFSIGAYGEQARVAFGTALRMAAEKGGQVWITEGGEVVAALVLTERLAEPPLTVPPH